MCDLRTLAITGATAVGLVGRARMTNDHMVINDAEHEHEQHQSVLCGHLRQHRNASVNAHNDYGLDHVTYSLCSRRD